MYEANPEFKQPNDDEPVWRYMDFAKFVTLLDTKTLFFARADGFDDPFEGSYPHENVSFYRNYHESVPLPPDIRDKLVALMNESMSNFLRNLRRWTALNCWHLNNYESAAMWHLYLKSNDGIAIRTKYGNLRDSFKNTSEPIRIGKVHYIDYDHDIIEGTSVFSPFLHKRNSFAHEREVRALVSKLPITEGLDSSHETMTRGINIEVDLNLLIEIIHVAPQAPEWLRNVVDSVVRRFGYKFEVQRSDMDRDPIY
ncbi:MAG TPA: hypothetical protein VJX94_11375 [Stellaceae bacterium]|nr:hypothetical protein [Stellaceae bacterium]